MKTSIQEILRNSGYQMEMYDHKKMEGFRPLYQELVDYAYLYELKNTAISLHILPCLLFSTTDSIVYKKDPISNEKYMNHALSTANLLRDIRPNISKKEMDLALSVALCHVLIEKIQFEKNGQELMDDFNLDPEVLELIYINLKDATKSDQYYKRIQENKIALLVKLADRCFIVQQLHTHSIQQVQIYVRETKEHFLPMCMFGKENYPEIYISITLLMEKMRYLTDVADILLTRFIERENALRNEMMTLQDENIRIRMLLKEMTL